MGVVEVVGEVEGGSGGWEWWEEVVGEVEGGIGGWKWWERVIGGCGGWE